MKNIFLHFFLFMLTGGLHLSAQTASIGGQVTTGQGFPIANVEVTLESSGPGSPLTVTTDATGNYLFEDVETGFDYTLTASKADAPINGVSVADLMIMRNYILGIFPPASPLQQLAGDVNLSGGVTTFDLVSIVHTLEDPDGMPLAPLFWRFVGLDSAQNPNSFLPANCCPMQILNLQNDLLNYTIYGIKLGDVNYSAELD